MSTSRTVLLATSNGAGLGHVTRLMAVARRMAPTVWPVVVTQSRGAPVVEQEGFSVEYVSSYGLSGFSRSRWNDYLHRRYSHLIDLYEPSAIVFDGVVPYPGLTSSWAGRRIPSLWLRRGLWRAGRGRHWLTLRRQFDLVVEPGDVASHLDMGATASERWCTPMVAPVTYLDAEELLGTDEARRDLSLPASGGSVLVSLGAGNINDTSSMTNRTVCKLIEIGFNPVLARSPIAHDVRETGGIQTVSVYPLSRYLNAFDFVVGAAGYNSIHEYIMAGTPSVLLPNEKTGLDNQILRAACMQNLGAGVLCQDDSGLDAALRLMADSHYRNMMRHRIAMLANTNGAVEIARILNLLSDHEGMGSQ